MLSSVYRYFNKKFEEKHPRPSIDTLDDCILKDTILKKIATTNVDGTPSIVIGSKQKTRSQTSDAVASTQPTES